MTNIKKFITFVKENINKEDDIIDNEPLFNNKSIENYEDDIDDFKMMHNPSNDDFIGENKSYSKYENKPSELDDYNLIDIFQESEI